MKSSPTAIRDGLDATIAASSSHTRHTADATRESKMANQTDKKWGVAYFLQSGGTIAAPWYGRFSTREEADQAAKKAHQEKPFLNFVTVEAL